MLLDVRRFGPATPLVVILTLEPSPSPGTAPVVFSLDEADSSTRETDDVPLRYCIFASYSLLLFHMDRAIAAIFRARVNAAIGGFVPSFKHRW